MTAEMEQKDEGVGAGGVGAGRIIATVILQLVFLVEGGAEGLARAGLLWYRL